MVHVWFMCGSVSSILVVELYMQYVQIIKCTDIIKCTGENDTEKLSIGKQRALSL